MKEEGLGTFLVGFLPAVLSGLGVDPIVVLISGAGSISWIGWQLYLSFRNDKLPQVQNQLHNPHLEQQYQGRIESLNKNICLLEDKISNLKAENKALKQKLDSLNDPL